MLKLHKKIEALRNSVGSSPIHRFYPTKQLKTTRSPKVDANSRLIKQYFCIFGVPDDYGTVPVKGCFSKSLEERGPDSKSNYKIVVLNQHDQCDPLCIPKILIEDQVGLYGEYEPDQIPSGDRLITQVRSGTINQGSYGFNYIWDKMEYDSETELIMMKECNLFEVSPVTIGSQKETFVKRSTTGIMVDEFLEEETEDLIKQLPRKYHLELRSLIDRHISLAQIKPEKKPLDEDEPQHGKVIDFDYLFSKL
jgi:HK97 family phage prohead protease